ncbi:hypothetical protein [Streptomyces sparsogenes]|uniref:hypothetical protein n=1 Tax=Streptomyces sparsogenes TaxID=67365 RepID=UPI003F4D2FAB
MAAADTRRTRGTSWSAVERTPDAADRPVVLEFKVDPEIASIPPHTMASQAKKAAKAMIHDPQKVGVTYKGMRQKLSQFTEHLPGRGHQ